MKPWYMNAVKTCKVLNRIANRFPINDNIKLTEMMDEVTQKLWVKQGAFRS